MNSKTLLVSICGLLVMCGLIFCCSPTEHRVMSVLVENLLDEAIDIGLLRDKQFARIPPGETIIELYYPPRLKKAVVTTTAGHRPVRGVQLSKISGNYRFRISHE